MGLSEKEFERTAEESEKTLRMFEALEQEYERTLESRKERARQAGVDSFEHMVALSQQYLATQDPAAVEAARAEFEKELRDEEREAELKYRQEQLQQHGGGAGKMHRLGKMI